MLNFISGASGGTPLKPVAELRDERVRLSWFICPGYVPCGTACLPVIRLLMKPVADDPRFAGRTGVFGLGMLMAWDGPACNFGRLHGGDVPTEWADTP